MKANTENNPEALVAVTEVQKRGPGRPKGHKVDWSVLTGNDWRFKNNKEIAAMVGTSTTNVYLKRRGLNAIGQAKYTGKAIPLGRPRKVKVK